MCTYQEMFRPFCGTNETSSSLSLTSLAAAASYINRNCCQFFFSRFHSFLLLMFCQKNVPEYTKLRIRANAHAHTHIENALSKRNFCTLKYLDNGKNVYKHTYIAFTYPKQRQSIGGEEINVEAM